MTTLEKIKADVNREYKWLVNTKYTIRDIDIAFGHIRSCIDKYAEQEPTIDMECDEIKILQKRSYLEGFHEAHKMLVKQEPCDDVVSRQAVEDALYEYSENNDANYNLIITEYIDTLPSVRPQEQTGHWIKHDNGAWWECSECHAERAYGNEYCPDCGSHNGDIAKMVEPQESEDCEEENIKHNYGLSKELQEHYEQLAEHYNKKARLQNG